MPLEDGDDAVEEEKHALGFSGLDFEQVLGLLSGGAGELRELDNIENRPRICSDVITHLTF